MDWAAMLEQLIEQFGIPALGKLLDKLSGADKPTREQIEAELALLGPVPPKSDGTGGEA